MRRHRARAVITTAAALAFVLAGSAVAAADTGEANDQTGGDQATDRPVRHRTDRPGDHRPLTDRPTDRPKDHPADRPTDRPTDRPVDRPTDRPTDRPHPCDREPAAERPDRCRDLDRDELHSLWKRCKEAAQSDTEIEDADFRKTCHRLLWKHNNWKRCLHRVAEHTDLRPTDHRHQLWKICHRLLWNHEHPA
jgi:hypothetical protein